MAPWSPASGAGAGRAGTSLVTARVADEDDARYRLPALRGRDESGLHHQGHERSPALLVRRRRVHFDPSGLSVGGHPKRDCNPPSRYGAEHALRGPRDHSARLGGDNVTTFATCSRPRAGPGARTPRRALATGAPTAATQDRRGRREDRLGDVEGWQVKGDVAQRRQVGENDARGRLDVHRGRAPRVGKREEIDSSSGEARRATRAALGASGVSHQQADDHGVRDQGQGRPGAEATAGQR